MKPLRLPQQKLLSPVPALYVIALLKDIDGNTTPLVPRTAKTTQAIETTKHAQLKNAKIITLVGNGPPERRCYA
jgi:hypothetical protein